MGVEIERKFLVASDAWRSDTGGTPYRQGYLCVDPQRTVRVRIAGSKGFVTIKGANEGGRRAEYEYVIPEAEAAQMLDDLCLSPLISKVRYRIAYRGHTWEVDDFLGENAGLILAEVELTEVSETVELPPWIGREVTDDHRYYNAYLCQHPFSSWKTDAN